MQNLVYQMDQGSGRKVIHMALFVLFAVAMAALYTFTNFQGMRDARAMEEAQVARNVVAHGQLLTQCVRPFAIRRLAERSAADANVVMRQPDLQHPPVWPVILAGALKMFGTPPAGTPTTAYVNGSDYVPVVTSHFFTILTALMVWWMGARLFDQRAGILAASAFLLSDLTWNWSLLGSGLSAATFFAVSAIYAGLLAGTPRVQPQPETVRQWLLPLLATTLFTALAVLTRYASGTIALIVVFFYIGFSHQERAWSKAALFLVLTVLLLVPWIARNVALCGQPFGWIGFQLLADTYLYPSDSFARSMTAELPSLGMVVYAVQVKMMTNLRTWGAQGFGFATGGIVMALFGAMYLHRFVRHASRVLRWCLVPAGIVAMLNAAAFGEDSLRTLAVFWPLALIYGTAFFLVLLDRLQFEMRSFVTAAMTIFLLVITFPLLFKVLPPRSGLPYPPYFHSFIGWVSTMIEPEECLVSDIPWATAWYGGRTSVLLPKDIDGFYQITEKYQRISLAYFTTVTRDKPWVRGLSDSVAPEFTWYQVFSAGKVPGNFPLIHGRTLAGSDQLILSDRQRW